MGLHLETDADLHAIVAEMRKLGVRSISKNPGTGVIVAIELFEEPPLVNVDELLGERPTDRPPAREIPEGHLMAVNILRGHRPKGTDDES